MNDVLGSISEFSIGLAGFSGVVAALLQRNQDLKEIDRLRVTINVVVALTPGIWALVFLALIEMEASFESVVRWISTGVLVSSLGLVALTRRMRGQLPEEQKGQFNPLVTRIVISITVVSVALNVYNIVILPPAASGILALVLVLYLVQAGSMFAGLLWGLMGNADASSET